MGFFLPLSFSFSFVRTIKDDITDVRAVVAWFSLAVAASSWGLFGGEFFGGVGESGGGGGRGGRG